MRKTYKGPRGGTTTVAPNEKLRKTIYFDPRLWRRIQRATKRAGESFSDLVARAVESSLDAEDSQVTDRPSMEELQRRLALLVEEATPMIPVRMSAAEALLTQVLPGCCWARFTGRDGVMRKIWLNEGFVRLTGYTHEEFEPMSRRDLLHPEDREEALRHIDSPEGRSEHQFRIIRKDGEVRHLRELMWIERTGDQLLAVGYTWDVTDSSQGN